MEHQADAIIQGKRAESELCRLHYVMAEGAPVGRVLLFSSAKWDVVFAIGMSLARKLSQWPPRSEMFSSHALQN